MQGRGRAETGPERSKQSKSSFQTFVALIDPYKIRTLNYWYSMYYE